MPSSSTNQSAHCEPGDCPTGLFDKIILSIALEQEHKNTQKLLCLMTGIFILSLVALPFSWSLFAHQWASSGINYFIAPALASSGQFFALWQDVFMSILESLPVIPIILFALNIVLLLFSVRLFFYKKGLLFKYLQRGVA
jgi:hypothetical protein